MNSILAVSQNAGQSLQVLILLGKTESIYVGVYRPSLSRMFRSSTSLLGEYPLLYVHSCLAYADQTSSYISCTSNSNFVPLAPSPHLRTT